MSLKSLVLALCLIGPALHAQEIGEDFRMTDTEARTIGPAQLHGKPYALFFGFTFCPDVCPMTLSVLAEQMEALGDDADSLQIMFVTVDPARDTPEVLREYLDWFGPNIIGLYGTEDETAATARAFRATYAKVPLDDGFYTMDHTAALYLMDAEGRFFDKLDYRAAPEVHADAFRRLLAAP